MSKKFLFIILIMIASSSAAQQLPHYSQYLLNDFAISPAVAGSKPYFDARTNIRNQWIGITDAPRTYILTVHGPIKNKNMGIGGMIYTDITGPTRRIGIQASYSYHIKVAENTKLSFGLSGGVLQWAIDGSKITLRDAGDDFINGYYQSVLVPDFAFGVHLYHPKYFISASAPQILQNRIDFFDHVVEEGRLEDHYYLAGGYKFRVSENVEIEPSAVGKYVYPVNPQAEISVRMIYKEDFWFGGSFRTEDAIAGIIGINFQENLMFGYSYDYTISNLSKYNTGTHEIMLGIKFLPNSKGQTKSMY